MSQAKILEAVEALKRFDRDEAVSHLTSEMATRGQSEARLRATNKLAMDIGEIDIALEAMRRVVQLKPDDLRTRLEYCGMLVEVGRASEALIAIENLPPSVLDLAATHHFRGTLASQNGAFGVAEEHFRKALAQGFAPQSWHALAMIKTFTPDDPDLATMLSLVDQARSRGGRVLSIMAYAIGKALDDCGDTDRAMTFYAEGAEVRRVAEKYDRAAVEARTDRTISDFTRHSLGALRPSLESSQRPIFVNGLPRSGTTLAEQILVSHSEVADGAEINLFRCALTSLVGHSFADALRHDDRGIADPWGKLARTYLHLVAMRFGTHGRIVDKTLLHSRVMGQILHALPNAPIIWMRRDPADVAMSCYRTYFASSIAWSWDLGDIGHYLRQEDRLFAHWLEVMPERILVVPYETLVKTPEATIAKMAAHAGLCLQDGMMTPHLQSRSVRTASVQQVRAPIGTTAIGKSARYDRHLDTFYEQYCAD